MRNKIINQLKYLHRQLNYKLNYLELSRLKNKYKGKRGFVVCNGPSLKISDLDLLRNDVSIATNRIYLAFEKTEWRPNYYIVISPLLVSKYWDEIKDHFNKVFFANYTFPKSTPKPLKGGDSMECNWRS
jgi:hypothetical protein